MSSHGGSRPKSGRKPKPDGSTTISMSVPTELLAKIDVCRASLGLTRQEWLRHLAWIHGVKR